MLGLATWLTTISTPRIRLCEEKPGKVLLGKIQPPMTYQRSRNFLRKVVRCDGGPNPGPAIVHSAHRRPTTGGILFYGNRAVPPDLTSLWTAGISLQWLCIDFRLPYQRGASSQVKPRGHSPNFIEQTAHCDDTSRGWRGCLCICCSTGAFFVQLNKGRRGLRLLSTLPYLPRRSRYRRRGAAVGAS